MSVNHFSLNLTEPHCYWTPIMDSSHSHSPKTHNFYATADHPPHPTATDFNLNLNIHHHRDSQDEDDHHHRETTTSTQQIHKEPMFEKPLTPSDVGKLNRLVIPKQHAEKYFPLGGTTAESADHQKGLLLSFEDESGKPWRFRYSYWNSSQSYVLTKGWSRFVKEKRLDAGDVVLFERHRMDGDRLFIGWRRRSSTATATATAVPVGTLSQPAGAGAHVSAWTTRMFYDAHSNYPSHHLPLSLPLPIPYQPGCLHAGGVVTTENNADSNQRGASGNNPRRVRLFGVNLECPDDSEPSTPDGSSQSSHSGQPHYQYYSNASHPDHNMNINFNQMRYHQG